VLARDVIKEVRLRDEGTNMIKFGLSFETPVRPGLLQLNSQFSCSPYPIATRQTFWVSASGGGGDGGDSSSCTYRTHELKQGKAGRPIFGLQKGIVMGAANA
jgi:hypothetical protein